MIVQLFAYFNSRGMGIGNLLEIKDVSSSDICKYNLFEELLLDVILNSDKITLS